MKKIIISAPFGNYLNFAGATRTYGTYTLKYRGGIPYRIWRCLLTLRYNRRTQSWTNKLGLPNPGILSLKEDDYSDAIISIHGFNRQEWLGLAVCVALHHPLAVELNLSCPNVGHTVIVDEVTGAIEYLINNNIKVIAKLPPVRWMSLAEPLYDLGVRVFHCCNTIPTPGGGQSGKPLKQYSLWAVDDMRKKYGESIIIIGGGGVTHIEDVHDYLMWGADHVAVGGVLLNPFNWRRIRRIIKEMI